MGESVIHSWRGICIVYTLYLHNCAGIFGTTEILSEDILLKMISCAEKIQWVRYVCEHILSNLSSGSDIDNTRIEVPCIPDKLVVRNNHWIICCSMMHIKVNNSLGPTVFLK